MVLDRLILVDARHPRDTSFVFAGHVTGGELEPQLGEIAETGWLGREEIGGSPPGLARLRTRRTGPRTSAWSAPRIDP